MNIGKSISSRIILAIGGRAGRTSFQPTVIKDVDVFISITLKQILLDKIRGVLNLSVLRINLNINAKICGENRKYELR